MLRSTDLFKWPGIPEGCKSELDRYTLKTQKLYISSRVIIWAFSCVYHINKQKSISGS